MASSGFPDSGPRPVLSDGENALEPEYVDKKREDYLHWDEYFMSVALLSAERSKDPNTQVGACIVDNIHNMIIGTGYNGMPRGCPDDDMNWNRRSRTGDALETKNPFVCHAAMNAVVNMSAGHREDCRIYTTLFPCVECAKLIIQSGIKKVIYLSDKYHYKNEMKASRSLFDRVGLEYVKFEPRRREVVINFQPRE